jgi:hypothetical protein
MCGWVGAASGAAAAGVSVFLSAIGILLRVF